MGLHHLMIGTWTPPGAIFTVQFDDEALTLKLLKRTEIPHDEPISWMTFDHTRKTIYGAALKKWSSFTVTSPTDISHNISHSMTHNPSASLSTTNTRAIFLLAANKPPYSIYCNPFYLPYSDAITIYPASAFAASTSTPTPTTPTTTATTTTTTDTKTTTDLSIQHIPLSPTASIHGAVFDPKEEYLYSADLTGNKLWIHHKTLFSSSSSSSSSSPSLPSPSPSLTLVASIPAPHPSDHPRWLAIHPTGNYLYALMESSNRICEYVIDPYSHLPVYTHHSYPLIPPGIPGGGGGDMDNTPCPEGEGDEPKKKKSMYRADVCALSFSGRYMFASSRANSFNLTGYLSVFRLRECGSIETQLHLLPTPTSGGHSNAVSPCPWSDDWLALTDDQEGWIEIYRWNQEFLHRVARCRIQEPGFGMNAIWYD